MKRLDPFTETFALVFAAVQENEIFQIISFVLSILAVAVSIGYTVYKWYKEATKDGKIDDKEIDELHDKIMEEIEKKKGKHNE